MAISGDRSVVRTLLGTQGTSEVLAYTATIPIIVCAADDPLRAVSGAMSQRTDMFDPQHESIIADARKLWGWPVFPGLGYRTPVQVGPDVHEPRFVVMIENVPQMSSPGRGHDYDVQLQFMPRDDGVTPQAKKIHVCTTKVRHQGAFEAPISGSTEHGDHVIVEATDACKLQTICPQEFWWATDQVLKICIRPTLTVKIGDEEYPTTDDLAAGDDAFTKQFQEAFPAAHALALRSGNGGAVQFFGIDSRWTSGPRISIARYRPLGRSGLRRSSEDTASGFLRRNGHAQRYIDVVELYGNHEGGWYALQTYDGPKLSFGWAQLTFGPNPSRGTTVTEGWGKNFMSFLAARYADCFQRLFGVYGYRVTFASADERDAWTNDTTMALRYSPTIYDQTFLWRLPCCWNWGETALPTSHIHTPPDALKLTRVQTASIGFAGLMVQAITDSTFEAAMAQWIAGMIDRAAAAAGSNPTKGDVTRQLFLAIRGPGTGAEELRDNSGYAPEVNQALLTPLAAERWNAAAPLTSVPPPPRPPPRPLP